MAFARQRNVRNLFRAPILENRPATWADVSQLTFDEAEYGEPDLSRDGRLAVASNRSGNWEVWTMSPEGGDMRQFTSDPATDRCPRLVRLPMFHGIMPEEQQKVCQAVIDISRSWAE